MSDGQSDYTRWMNEAMTNAYRDPASVWYSRRMQSDPAPIVPRREDIRIINPTPPYHWLGREAEVA